MASSNGGGSVVQEKVNSGSSSLDREINSFYSCISKTHQDPPTIDKVDSCYYQGLGGSGVGGSGSGSNGGSSDVNGITGSGDISTALPAPTGHHHKLHVHTDNSGVGSSST